MRTTAKCSLVSLRGHTLKRPFTVSYKRANVTISLSEEIHFINVVRPGTQFQLADLANKFKTAIKLSMKSDHNLWRYFQVRNLGRVIVTQGMLSFLLTGKPVLQDSGRRCRLLNSTRPGLQIAQTRFDPSESLHCSRNCENEVSWPISPPRSING